MKRDELVFTAAIFAAVALSAPVVSAESLASPEARAWAAAEQSPDALRHFVQRTRMIYALNYSDYFKPGERVPDADIAIETDGYSSSAAAAADAAARQEKELDELREQIYRDMKYE
jgi:hypothetical protein